MTVPVRISAEEARRKSVAGEVLLVCAYEGADQFAENNLEGAMPWRMFESRLPELSRDQPVIFYCA